MDSKISIIIPVYNVEKYLEQCLSSLVNQKYRNLEIILIDDGSTDSSLAVCKQWAQKDERIIVIHKENSGVSATRNVGLNYATGAYVTFVDSDDYIEYAFLSDAIYEIETNEADVFYSGVVRKSFENDVIVASEVYSVAETKMMSPKELLTSNTIPVICSSAPWAKLFKTSMIKENNICFDINMDCGEDAYFNLDILKYCKKVFFSNKIYYNYLIRNKNSLTQKYNPRFCEYIFKIEDEKREMLLHFGMNDFEINNFENRYLSSAIATLPVCYKFKEKNIRQDCKNVIKLIEKNRYIRSLKFTQVKGLKLKLILFLFKIRMPFVLKMFLDIKYRKKLAK